MRPAKKALWSLAVLLLAAIPTQAQEGERIPVEPWPPPPDPQELTSGTDLLHLVPIRPISTAPLRISSNNLLNALFGFLPMESATTLPEGRTDAGMFLDFSSGSLEVLDSEFLFRYDAFLAETNLEYRSGLEGDFEWRAGIDVSNLLEQNDDIFLLHNGRVIIGAGTRSMAPGDLRLAMKKTLSEFGDGGSAGVVLGTKIPLSRSKTDLLTSGGVDFATSLLLTQKLEKLTLHANLGAIVPGDVELFEEDVDTSNALTLGVSAAYQFEEWGVLIAQIQGNQGVFKGGNESIGILEDEVATFHVGLRLRLGSYFFEGSLGSGLTDRSSDAVITLALVIPL